jgi:hypothetical protein
MRTRRAAAPFYAPATETAQDCSTTTVQGLALPNDPGPTPVPGPGSPGFSMDPADIPAIREPILEPQRHPGVPAGVLTHPRAVTRDQLRRQGRPAPVQQA